MRRRIFPVVLFLCIAMAVSAESAVILHRFAIVAGSNDGGKTLARLKYAESDARGFAAVLQELGGVKPADMVLVVGPDSTRFHDAMGRVSRMVSSPREMDERRELILYYSGHSDDDGLILGKDRLTWEALRGELNAIPADVKVAILDSCSSGSLTRAKGGVARPAFLFDASADMSGHAYLTSASAEEAAQESDRIGASFFTHYLISGLRGAADTVGDGVVTLNEAYAYAFQETLASTEKTSYGPQHAAYDINLTGSGDLVLTDLRSAEATVSVNEDVAGRLYFRDSSGKLAVELNKTAGQKVELGMAPGTYAVVLDNKGSRSGAELRVSADRRASLSLANLKPIALDKATARGANPVGARPARPVRPAPRSDPASAIGAAIGAAVGSAIGGAMGNAVNAAISAAATAASSSAQAQQAPPWAGPPRAPAPPAAAQEPAVPESPAPAEQAPAEAAAPGQTEAGPDAGVPASYEVPADDSGDEPRTLEDRGAARTEKFSFAVVPDFSQGVFSSTTDHVIGINLLAGSASSSLAFEIGGLANFESRNVRGFQAAGLSNMVLGDVNGFQTAGLFNYSGGTARWVQMAGLANVATASRGAQVAGLGNVVLRSSEGAQVAGLFNWSRAGAEGAQVAGLANWVGGTITGAQVAGVFNWTGTISGPQISVVNIADTVDGAQVGVVNIARHVSGTQVGVINITDEIDGVPVGVFSFVAQGRHSLEVWYDFDGSTNASFSLGTNRFYTVFNAGWVPGSEPSEISFGLGLGGHSDIKPFYMDYSLSLMAAQQGVSQWNVKPSGSLYPRVRLVVGLPLFGGAALEAGMVGRILIPSLSSSVAGADPTTTVFRPSFILGVRI
jgi:hypothetical protein